MSHIYSSRILYPRTRYIKYYYYIRKNDVACLLYLLILCLFSGLLFREADREMGFALTLGNAAFVPVIRSILMVIQAHILRALLFEVRSSCFYRPKFYIRLFFLHEKGRFDNKVSFFLM